MGLFPVETLGSITPSARSVGGWVERLARVGYAARGLVYVAVGVIAARGAFRAGIQATGSEGALRTILRQPLGMVLLGVVAVGLLGYALWRFVQAVRDPERKGTDLRGVATRLGYAGTGLIHFGLAVAAVRLLLGGSRAAGDGGEDSADHWTALLMRQPAGRWLVALIGAAIIFFGLWQLYRAYRTQLGGRLNLSGLSSRAEEWLIRFGRLGYGARGVVFGVIGLLLVQAARRFDPQSAVGVAGALQTLEVQPYGPWLIGGVGAGLIAFGLFELAKANYREIRPG